MFKPITAFTGPTIVHFKPRKRDASQSVVPNRTKRKMMLRLSFESVKRDKYLLFQFKILGERAGNSFIGGHIKHKLPEYRRQ
jgi:hypothetical protein